MKKITIALLALIMAFAFVACSSGDATDTGTQNEIADLYANEELTPGMTSCTEGVWKGVFYTEDYSEVKHVVATMTKEQRDAYEAIDFADDDAEDQQQAIIFQIEDVTVTDITDEVPTQETLDTWVGKTCGDMEGAGFEQTGNTFVEDTPGSLELYYDGPDYCVAVGFDKKLKLNIDDLSPNDMRALVIKSVRMTALGSKYCD